MIALRLLQSGASSNRIACWVVATSCKRYSVKNLSSLSHYDFKSRNHSSSNTGGLTYELSRYDGELPIHSSFTPPSTWYTEKSFFQLERESVLLNNWVAVSVWTNEQPGAYKTGSFLGEPYLLTQNNQGQLQAFYNVCTHGGSCLAGPWTAQQAKETSFRLTTDLVGQASEGCLRKGEFFQCPYHGWRFNLDGRLTRATHTKGIQNFKPKDYSLKAIPVKQVGPIVFLNFGRHEREIDSFDQSQTYLSERLHQNGFARDLSDLQLIESRQYVVKVSSIVLGICKCTCLLERILSSLTVSATGKYLQITMGMAAIIVAMLILTLRQTLTRGTTQPNS